MDKGSWLAQVHEVAKYQTQLSDETAAAAGISGYLFGLI